MNTSTTIVGPAPARRAAVTLAGLAVAGLAVLVGAAVALAPSAETPPPGAAGPVLDSSGVGAAATGLVDGLPGDAAARAGLATRPMPHLPLAAALPGPLASGPNPAPLPGLPAATGHLGTVPAGFPPTAQGAVAALAAIEETGLRGGDPELYRSTYDQLAAPGAPPAGTARLTGLLREMRAAAGLPATGPVPNLEVTYQVSQAQIKGVLDEGGYAVVCVLGQLTAAYQGQYVTAGVGDCQAMRYLAASWRIAPGPAAAPAPDAWPGSQPAVDAGYRGITR